MTRPRDERERNRIRVRYKYPGRLDAFIERLEWKLRIAREVKAEPPGRLRRPRS